MTNSKKDLGKSLKEIAEYCHDSAEGFERAAESVVDERSQLAAQWKGIAATRRDYKTQVDDRLLCIGEEISEGGTFKGVIHRGIIKLKSLFSSDDFDAALEECIRGESEFAELIDDVLEETTIDAKTRELLVEIRQNVERSLYDLKRIKPI